ncbi:DUF1302 family protein [Inmirania thermothiophila]|uniref:Sporulation related protein n=1 Tax=Inmirania thermothiophila TaxID=1750597 RepID=A0A3N1Y7E4_9GAMM|nr:DUF1302 family protein [Inmirania thermothiophila]ROR34733.1 hypothetical protein EDC57_0637 [Inmirania thermothiophila]
MRAGRTGAAVLAAVLAAAAAEGRAGAWFPTREAAEAEAARLRAEGQAARVEEVEGRVGLQRLEVLAPDYAAARRVRARLEALGLGAWIAGRALGRGYAVAAGEFASAEALAQARARLEAAGLGPLRVVAVQARRRYFRIRRAEEGGGEVILLGAAPPPAAAGPAPRGAAVVAPRRSADLWLEAGGGDGPDQGLVRAGLAWAREPSAGWGWRIEGRLRAAAEGPGPEEAELEPGESWLRWRGGPWRLTLGWQSVIWGRMDESPLADRLSVPDLRRFLLDDLAERRLPVPALRLEWARGGWKADLLAQLGFHGAELPEAGSAWYPVDRVRGRILGLPPDPVLAALVQRGGVGEETPDGGGIGLRLSRAGEGLDLGATLVRGPEPLPYYGLDEPVRAALLASGGDVGAALAAARGPALVGRHPRTWAAGVDFAREAGGATWRGELLWLSDVAATTPSLAVETRTAWAWGVGVELFPGDGDLRLELQLLERRLGGGAVLDRRRQRALTGAVEALAGHGRWRWRLRFVHGLDADDRYLNPEVRYLGLEPHELYLGAHLFSGDADTAGGFHAGHDLAVLGWRLRY